MKNNKNLFLSFSIVATIIIVSYLAFNYSKIITNIKLLGSCNILINSNNPQYNISIVDQEKFNAFIQDIGNCTNNFFTVHLKNPNSLTEQTKNIQVTFTQIPQPVSVRNQQGLTEYTYLSINHNNLANLYVHPTENHPDFISYEQHVYNVFLMELAQIFNGKEVPKNFLEIYPNFSSIGLAYETL